MGYIKDQSHFINYLNKMIRIYGENIDGKRLMSSDFYVKHIYVNNLQDAFCWEVKTNIDVLYEENVLNFITRKTWISSYNETLESENWTDKFKEFIASVHRQSGVYLFETKRKQPLYVGVSINLNDRIPSSYNEKFLNYEKPVYLKCILCSMPVDAAILEVYLIGKLKPAFNKTSKYTGDISLKIENIPCFTKRMLCKEVKNGKK